MNKVTLQKIYQLLGFALLLSSSVYAVEIRQYQRIAQIELSSSQPAKNNINFKAEIPIDLLEGTNNYDLRILDKNRKEIPYLIEVSSDQAKVIPALKVYNQSVLKNKKQYLELILDKDKLTEINEINLEVTENNFDHQVSVWGRDSEKEEWKLLKENLKIMSTYLPEQKIDFKLLSLPIPTSTYKFLKLEISLTKNQKPLSITEISTKYKNKSLEYNKINLPLQKIDLREKTDLSSKNKSIWLLDSQKKKYYFDKIVFEFNENNFSRAINLFCSSKKEIDYLENPDLQHLTNSSFYKFNTSSNLEITINEQNCNYYLLEINQGNNAEIVPIKAAGLSKKMYLKFIADNTFEKPFTIYAKSKKAEIPDYDLAERIKQNEINEFSTATIISLKRNPQYQEQPIPKNHLESSTYLPYLLAGTLILLITWYIWNTVKINPKS